MKEAVKKRLRNWQKALWSDKTRICLYNTDGCAHVRRLTDERLIVPCLQGTVAGVWHAFSSDRSLDLKSVEQKFKFPKITEQYD